MVLLVTTPTIVSALEIVSPASRDELQLPHSPAVGSPISHDQVIVLARYFTSSSGKSTQKEAENRNKEPEVPDPSEEKRDEECDDNAATEPPPLYTLNSLLRGTTVYIPPPPPKPEPVRSTTF
jgi:hypothetical protein